MIRRILGSKWLVSIIAMGTVAAVVGGALYIARNPIQRQQTYCAMMPDAIGLFPGNPVTRLGVPIGRVKSIAPEANAARVEFAVDAKEQLPTDVGAVTVAESLIASRQLALIGDAGGPALKPGTCITKTNTPRSLTKTLDAVGKAARELTSGGGPGQAKQVENALASLSKETKNSGPAINQLLTSLAGMVSNPGPGMSDLAETLDSLISLTGGMTDNWSVLKGSLGVAPAMMDDLLTPLAATTTQLAIALTPLVKMLTPLIDHYGYLLWPILDAAIPLSRLAAAGVRDYGDLLGIVPPLIDAFDIAVDQRTMRLRISYKPPNTQIPAKTPQHTCDSVNRLVPGQCQVLGPDRINVDFITAILRATGAAR